MRMFVVSASLVLAFGTLGFAQPRDKHGCPVISVIGPAGILDPAEVATFTVEVKTVNALKGLKYSWRTSFGRIVKGKRTHAINVKVPFPPFKPVVATVTVKGLPLGCPDSASGAYNVIFDPGPTKLDEVSPPQAKISDARLRRITKSLKKHPTAQIYVYLKYKYKYKDKTERDEIRKIRDQLILRLGIEGQAHPQYTFVEVGGTGEGIEFWLVPAGVVNPTIDNQ